MKKLALVAVGLLAACGGKKDPGTGSATGSSTASGSAPAGSGAAPAGSGSAPAGSGSAPAGSGSDTAAGSGSGSNVAAGSGSGQLIDDPGIKFEKLPDGWESGGGKLDTFEAVNESKFPVDNATFIFEYGLDSKDLPADPKEYAAVLEKSGAMEKITKSEKTANGHYYESAHAFRYVVVAGDKRIHCGGPLYNDSAHKDYDTIPKVREKVIADAKKICQTAKL